MSNTAHFVLTPAILKALRASRAVVVSSNLDADCAVVDGAAIQGKYTPVPWFGFTHIPNQGTGALPDGSCRRGDQGRKSWS